MKIVSTFLMLMIFSLSGFTQNVQLEWAEPNTTLYSNSNLSICGPSRVVTLKASFTNDPLCPYYGWGANRYRFRTFLFKNNVVVASRVFQASSCVMNDFYSNYNLTEGVYKVQIILEVRGFLWRWSQRRNMTSSSFTVARTPATPAFTINGITPNKEIPIELCPNEIIIDPSPTTCEDAYYIGIWEFDFLNWSRPLSYEWGKWFSGQAPTSLNLQQLSAQHSFGSAFLGNDMPRQGEILYGGNLPSGNDRYYHISVCTGTPTWQCASAVIKVKCNCE